MKKILIFAIFSMIGCNKKLDSKPIQEIKIENNWKKDSLGRNRLITIELQDKLLKQFYEGKNNSQEFEKIFGKPNNLEILSDEQIVLVYYTESICNDGKINMKGDKGYAKFYFVKGILKHYDNIIE